jgi:hypothetical protein
VKQQQKKKREIQSRTQNSNICKVDQGKRHNRNKMLLGRKWAAVNAIKADMPFM